MSPRWGSTPRLTDRRSNVTLTLIVAIVVSDNNPSGTHNCHRASDLEITWLNDTFITARIICGIQDLGAYCNIATETEKPSGAENSSRFRWCSIKYRKIILPLHLQIVAKPFYFHLCFITKVSYTASCTKRSIWHLQDLSVLPWGAKASIIGKMYDVTHFHF
jgi:hypothetical protein